MAAGDIFSSGIPLNFLGYSILFQPGFVVGIPGSTLDELVEANPGIIDINDPRGLFKAGQVPSKKLSYRIYQEVDQPFTTAANDLAPLLTLGSFGGGALGTFVLSLAVPDVVFSTTKTRAAIIVFEGRDVIDLPTDSDGLVRDGDTIILPEQIFRGYHAGIDPLINPGDNITQKLAIASLTGSSDNLFVRVAQTDNVTEDVRQLGSGVRLGGPRNLLDTASNRMQVSGDPGFISYTAIDRPLFRDIIVTTVSTSAFGINTATGGFIPNEATPGEQPTFFVVRFAYAQVGTDSDGNPINNWKLAESFGVDPVGGTTPTPPDIIDTLSDAGRSADTLAAVSKHYIYNLNAEGPDVDESFDVTPLLHGYSPVLASAKQNTESDYFDEGFSSQSFEVVPGFAAQGGLITTHGVGVGDNVPTTIVVPKFSYTSPTYEIDINARGRIGVEYVIADPSGISISAGISDTILMAKTVERTPGLAVIYDCCLNLVSVIDVEDGPNGPYLVEREFDDVLWTKSQQLTPDSISGKFMLGEFPSRSIGKVILTPRQIELEDATSGILMNIPDGSYVTAIQVRGVLDSSDGTFSLHDDIDASGEPIFELAFPGADPSKFTDIQEQVIFIGTPILAGANSFRNGGGVALDAVFVNREGQTYLPALTGNPDGNASDVQISFIEAETFYMGGGNQAADGSCSKGWSYLALENGDRIDLATKRFYSSDWVPIRDVTLRIMDGFEQEDFDASEGGFPAASMPFIVSDPETDMIFLFYVYKGFLMVKNIPGEILLSEPLLSGTATFSTESEQILIKKMHDIVPTVVYDGSGDSQDALATDIALSAVYLNQSPDDENNEAKPVSQYSCYFDQSGFMHVFIQAGDAIIARRSSNLGTSWADSLPRNFKFMPLLDGEDASDLPSEEAPSCMYDPETNNVLIFFVSDRRLFVSRIPSETLRQPQDAAIEDLADIKPILLIGDVTNDLLSRGIRVAASVSDSRNSLISPHRVAGYVTSDGYYRVFYKDDESLKSLVSFDIGDTWLTENQYLERNVVPTALEEQQ